MASRKKIIQPILSYLDKREINFMYYRECKDIKEIAEHFHIKHGTVRECVRQGMDVSVIEEKKKINEVDWYNL